MSKIDVGFLARVIRVAWEAALLRDGGHDDKGAADMMEKAAHELWRESGFNDASTRDLCLWAEMVGERFEFAPHQHVYIPQAWNNVRGQHGPLLKGAHMRKHEKTKVIAVPVCSDAHPQSTLGTWAQKQSSEMLIPVNCTPIYRCGHCCQETESPGQLCKRCSTLECIECGRTINRADARLGRCTSCRQMVASEVS